jgi:ankyrin repeat protein
VSSLVSLLRIRKSLELSRVCSSLQSTVEDGASPLFIAAKNNHAAVVSYLLTRPEVDLELATSTGATALTIAARQGNYEVVKALLPLPASSASLEPSAASLSLPRRANVNAVEKDGWSALLIACLQGNEDIIRHLVKAGADKHHVTHSGVSLTAPQTRVKFTTSTS